METLNLAIVEMEQMVELTKNAVPRQKKWFEDMLRVAKPITISRMKDVLTPEQIEVIQEVIKPEKKQCYKNAHLLTCLYPEWKYCEGKVCAPFGIDHAFNKVGDKYIDITFELALNDDPTKYDYAVIGEYDLDTIDEVTSQTGVYGEIYRHKYLKSQCCANCRYHGKVMMCCFNDRNEGMRVMNPNNQTCEHFEPEN